MTNPFFEHTFKYPPGLKFYQVVEVGHTQESEWPWRSGLSLVFRLPWSDVGHVVGLWTRARDEAAFHHAAGARVNYVPTEKLRLW